MWEPVKLHSPEKWSPLPQSLPDLYFNPIHQDMQSWLSRSICSLNWPKGCDQVWLRCQCFSLQYMSKRWPLRPPSFMAGMGAWNGGREIPELRHKTSSQLRLMRLKKMTPPSSKSTSLVHIKLSTALLTERPLCSFSPHIQCWQSSSSLELCHNPPAWLTGISHDLLDSWLFVP